MVAGSMDFEIFAGNAYIPTKKLKICIAQFASSSLTIKVKHYIPTYRNLTADIFLLTLSFLSASCRSNLTVLRKILVHSWSI